MCNFESSYDYGRKAHLENTYGTRKAEPTFLLANNSASVNRPCWLWWQYPNTF